MGLITWSTDKDKIVTLHELLDETGWEGTRLKVIGSSPEDYIGATHLFSVEMSKETADKFFGCARVFCASFGDKDTLYVYDQALYEEWIRKNEIVITFENRQCVYDKYRELHQHNCLREVPGTVRISI